MERFARLFLAGGVALVAGLWTVELAPSAPVRLFGAALSLAGAGALLAGIGVEIEPSIEGFFDYF
ncbi:MAG: hypothetical protein ABEH77_07230 [Halobacteriaceae archaeon]